MRRLPTSWSNTLAKLGFKRKRRPGRHIDRCFMRRRMQFEVLEERAMLSADTYWVTTLADTVNASDGVTSLREALVQAYDSTTDNDVICFNASLFTSGPATLTLAYDGPDSGSAPDPLTIDSSVTIQGPAANMLSINGNNQTGVFVVNTGITATIRGVRITGGSAASGGGIFSSGSLTVDSSQIDANTAYAGAGIYAASGALIVSNSTVANNSGAYAGGGIYISSAAASIVNSTISTNTAYYAGGGIYDGSSGAQIINSTVTANASTVASYGAGGGISGNSGTTLYNTIVAGNTAGNTAARDITGAFNSASAYNLIGYDSSTTNNINNDASGTGNHNQVGGESGAAAIDAGLAALGNYGGTVKTHALLATSPAIDKGSDSNLLSAFTADERGFARHIDSGTVGPTGQITDIGAFEFGGPITVDTFADENDSNYSIGHLSLREAIGLAALIPGNDTINFAPSLFSSGPTTITLSYDGTDSDSYPDQLVVDSNVTIQGPGADKLTINRSGVGRVFQVNSGVDSILSGVTVSGGAGVSGGGGIYSVGNTLKLDAVTITGNSATSSGGGIYVAAGVLDLEESTVDGNHVGSSVGGAWGEGGGIFIFGTVTANPSLIINGTTISNNTADGGGGLYFSSYQSGANRIGLIVNSTLSGNTATYIGGLRARYNTHFDIYNTTIAANSGAEAGGLDLVQGGTATLNNTIVADNTGTNFINIYGAVDATNSNNNLIGTSGTGGLTNGVNGNIVLNSFQFSGLAPLGNYGGPTKTMALLASSVAIDHGSNAKALNGGSSLIYDQRGMARNVDMGPTGPTGGTVDIGAFEFAFSGPIVVDTLADENDGHYEAGDLSLREALALGTLIKGNQTITFANSLFADGPATIHVTYDGPDAGTAVDTLTGNGIILQGPGADKLTIDAGGQTRVLNVSNTTIDGLTITGGHAVYGGGVGGSNLTITNARITGNTADQRGGGIWSNYGSLHIENSEISDNTATSRGGGISASRWYTDKEISIKNSTISGNHVTGGGGKGGGLYMYLYAGYGPGLDATITSSTISGNSAASGGGVYSCQANYYGGPNPPKPPKVYNTIIAGNVTLSGAASDVAGSGLDASSSHNIFGQGGTGLTTLQNGNMVVSSPGLEPLAFNGGKIRTQMLDGDSMAIAHGDPTLAVGMPTDARGYDRTSTNLQTGVVTLDAGDLQVQLSGGAAGVQEISGTPGPDTIVVTNNLVTVGATQYPVTPGQQIVIRAGSGNDVINATAATIPLTIYGDDGDDTIQGGSGNDLLYGGNGTDALYGMGGNDQLYDDASASFDGGAGNDTFYITKAPQFAWGSIADSGGNDTLNFSNWIGYGVAVDLNVGEFYTLWYLDGYDYLQHDTSLRIENLVGSLGNDYLTGNEQDNRIDGDGGTDVISGGDGNDTYAIDDRANASIRISDTAGNDTIDLSNWTGPKGATINLATPATLYSFIATSYVSTSAPSNPHSVALSFDEFEQIENVIGTSYDDNISGNSKNNYLFGSSGNDQLFGADGADILDGGTGIDWVDGGAGNDRLHGGSNTAADNTTADTLQGGDGDDTYVLTSSDVGYTHILQQPDGGTNSIDMSGSTTGATLDISKYFYVVAGSHGSDYTVDGLQTVFPNVNLDIIFGPYIQNVTGTNYDDTIVGNGLDNHLIGGDGSDHLVGGAGNDTLDGGNDDDLLEGGDGNDTLNGNAGNDQLVGDAGDDVLAGNAGDDDYVFVSTGSSLGTDTISESSGGGNDVLDFSQIVNGSGTGLNVDLLSTSTTVVLGTIASPQLQLTRLDGQEIERVEGTQYGDVIKGNSKDNVISGLNGNDEIHGGAGNDLIFGGPGDDVLHGDANDDRLIGGDGNDTITGDDGNDILEGDDGGDNLDGGANDDQLSGGDGNDSLLGGAGNDQIDGGTGSDSFLDSAAEAVNDITFDVDSSNVAPVFQPISTQQAEPNVLLSFSFHAADPNPGQSVTYIPISKPANSSLTSSGAFSWTPTTAQGNKSYEVTVAAIDSGNPRLETQIAVVITAGDGKPDPPSYVDLSSATTSSISLTWEAVAGATSYTLQRRLAGTGNSFTTIASPTTASYTDINLTPGARYEYQIQSVQSGAVSNLFSSPVQFTTLIDAPTSVSTSSSSFGTADIHWSYNWGSSPPANNIGQFRVEGLFDPAVGWQFVVNVAANLRDYHDVFLGPTGSPSPNQGYFDAGSVIPYRVIAINLNTSSTTDDTWSAPSNVSVALTSENDGPSTSDNYYEEINGWKIHYYPPTTLSQGYPSDPDADPRSAFKGKVFWFDALNKPSGSETLGNWKLVANNNGALGKYANDTVSNYGLGFDGTTRFHMTDQSGGAIVNGPGPDLVLFALEWGTEVDGDDDYFLSTQEIGASHSTPAQFELDPDGVVLAARNYYTDNPEGFDASGNLIVAHAPKYNVVADVVAQAVDLSDLGVPYGAKAPDIWMRGKPSSILLGLGVIARPAGYFIDLQANGVHDDEETSKGAYVAVNNNFDENNHNTSGALVPDNQPNGTTDRIIGPADPQLLPMTLHVYSNMTGSEGVPGTYKLDFPSQIKVWRREGSGYIQVTSGASINDLSSDTGQQTTIDGVSSTVDLLVEGISTSPTAAGSNVTATFTPTPAAGATSDAVADTIAVHSFQTNGKFYYNGNGQEFFPDQAAGGEIVWNTDRDEGNTQPVADDTNPSGPPLFSYPLLDYMKDGTKSDAQSLKTTDDELVRMQIYATGAAAGAAGEWSVTFTDTKLKLYYYPVGSSTLKELRSGEWVAGTTDSSGHVADIWVEAVDKSDSQLDITVTPQFRISKGNPVSGEDNHLTSIIGDLKITGIRPVQVLYNAPLVVDKATVASIDFQWFNPIGGGSFTAGAWLDNVEVTLKNVPGVGNVPLGGAIPPGLSNITRKFTIYTHASGEFAVPYTADGKPDLLIDPTDPDTRLRNGNLITNFPRAQELGLTSMNLGVFHPHAPQTFTAEIDPNHLLLEHNEPGTPNVYTTPSPAQMVMFKTQYFDLHYGFAYYVSNDGSRQSFNVPLTNAGALGVLQKGMNEFAALAPIPESSIRARYESIKPQIDLTYKIDWTVQSHAAFPPWIFSGSLDDGINSTLATLQQSVMPAFISSSDPSSSIDFYAAVLPSREMDIGARGSTDAGVTYKSLSTQVALINDTDSSTLSPYTLAHELGHLTLPSNLEDHDNYPIPPANSDGWDVSRFGTITAMDPGEGAIRSTVNGNARTSYMSVGAGNSSSWITAAQYQALIDLFTVPFAPGGGAGSGAAALVAAAMPVGAVNEENDQSMLAIRTAPIAFGPEPTADLKPANQLQTTRTAPPVRNVFVEPPKAADRLLTYDEVFASYEVPQTSADSSSAVAVAERESDLVSDYWHGLKSEIGPFLD